jgi:hypothetical protein
MLSEQNVPFVVVSGYGAAPSNDEFRQGTRPVTTAFW